MSVEIISARLPTTGGCGCGGGCGGSDCGASGCGCGGGEARAPAGGFVRPRFFAGQLLCDEDLGQLDAYVAAKNRLRNRFLHGDGVVCGLEVTCHPCGGGSVIVRSGYALDCCGNDIVVPCPQELDILELIRELEIGTKGCDCGDPCAGRHDPCADRPGDRDDDAGAEEQEPVRRWYLYVRYAERLSDPVAPYSIDEPCGPQGCEPTRVREGYQFLLRGHRRPRPDDDVLTRLLECLGDPREVERAVGGGRLARLAGRRLRAALRAQDRDEIPAVGREDLERPEFGRVRAFVDGEAPGDEPAARRLADDLSQAAVQLARAKALSQADRERAGIGDDRLEEASGLLRTAAERLREQGVTEMVAEPARPYADAALRAAARAADQPAGEPLAGDTRLLAQGSVADRQLLGATAADLRAQKEWLLDRVERTRVPTDCRLLAEVLAVRVPVVRRQVDEGGRDVAGEREDAAALADAAEQLARLTLRYLIACLCAAVNPPCPPCPDDAVLLAAVDVADCEVQDICLAVRSYVLTGPNLRYWLPPLSALQQLLEKLCCVEWPAKETKPKEPEEPEEPEEPIEPGFLRAALGGQPTAATPRDRALLAVGAEFASLDPDRPVEALLAPALSPATLQGGLVRAAVGSPAIRAAVGGIASAAVGDLLSEARGDARRLQEIAVELTQPAAVDERVGAAVDRQMATVRRDVGQLKSQTSRHVNRLATTVQQRLAEVDQRLRQLDELRQRLAAEAERPAGGGRTEGGANQTKGNGNGKGKGGGRR